MNNTHSSLPNAEKIIGYLGLYAMAAGAAILFIFPNYSPLASLIIFLGFLNWAFALWRAKALDKLIAGEGCIARWTYDSKLWQTYLETAPILNKNVKLIILGSFVLATLLGVLAITFDFLLGFKKEELTVYTTIGGFFSLGTFIFFATSNTQEKAKTGRVLFSANAIYIEGVYYNWHQSDLKLNKFSYDLETQTINFVLAKPQSDGYNYTYITLPVPPNEEESLEIILDTYKAYIQN